MVDFGALRWDAYYDMSNLIAQWTCEMFGPQRHRHRTPLHGIEVNPERIVWQPSQAVIDAEINAAAAGGLNYWAFLRYRRSIQPGMNAAWNLFQTSSIKNSMKWAAVHSNDLGDWITVPNYATEVADTVAWMQQANYKKVLGNRPLLFIMYDPGGIAAYWNNNDARYKAALDQIRTDAMAAGLGNPYMVVFQIGSVGTSEAKRIALGGQAISDYAAFPGGIGRGPYSGVATAAQNYWSTMASASAKIVPICMLGWARQPIYERPSNYGIGPYIGLANVWNLPTTTEITAHFDACQAYVAANPVACEIDCALIYAWNEVAEGGWLIPTYSQPNGERLAALYTALHN